MKNILLENLSDNNGSINEGELIICYPKTLNSFNFTIEKFKEYLAKKGLFFTDAYEVPSHDIQYYCVDDVFYNDFIEINN